MEVLEHREKTYDDIKEELEGLGTCYSIDFLNKLENYLNKQGFGQVLTFYKDHLSANSYVGVIKYKNFQLEILPKLLSNIDDNLDKEDDEYKKQKKFTLKNLIFMLSYTKNLDIKISDNTKLSKSKNPFLEVLIKEFAQSLFECLKMLTPKNYIREEDNLNFLRGKLKFSENIRYNSANQAKFYCEFDEFSENNILNQLCLYVSTCLFNITKDGNNKKLLKFIMNYYSDIDLVRLDKFKVNKILLSRNQQLFSKPFKLAKMFIEHSSVDLSKNKIENITLLWDMNVLFEEFIYELLRKSNINYDIKYQKGRRLLVDEDANKKYGCTYVDIFLQDKNNQKDKIILDTKYKLRAPTKTGVRNSDIYQVATYCLIHDSKKAILLHPTKDEKTDNKFAYNNVYKLNVQEKDNINVQFNVIKIWLNEDLTKKENIEKLKTELIKCINEFETGEDK